jgi:hypothetical protein
MKKYIFGIFTFLLLFWAASAGNLLGQSRSLGLTQDFVITRTAYMFARDIGGLRLWDDGGVSDGNGIYIRDGGYVALGDTSSLHRFNISFGHEWVNHLTMATGDTLTAALGDSANAQPANAVGQGVYKYKVTFITPEGETLAGTSTNGLTVSDSVATPYIAVTGVPLYSGKKAGVIQRKIYRTLKDGSTYYLAKTLSDNITTAFSDTLGDNGICGNATEPGENTTAGSIFSGTSEVARIRSDGLWRFLNGFLYVVQVDTTNANVTQYSRDSGKTYSNHTFSSKWFRYLPAASRGLIFEYVVFDSDSLVVIPYPGDTIWDATGYSARGYASATKVSTAKLKAINDSIWVVDSKTGTWALYTDGE